MELYLQGPPMSTRKNALGVDVAPQTRESVQLALVTRADQLHGLDSSGLDPTAYKLRLERTVSQLRSTRRGERVILTWVWLSDGSKFRVAWFLETAENRLYRHWKRVPWESIHFRNGGQPRAS
jgi:hypothetical protein